MERIDWDGLLNEIVASKAVKPPANAEAERPRWIIDTLVETARKRALAQKVVEGLRKMGIDAKYRGLA